MNFRRILKKHMKACSLVSASEGQYIDGRWTANEAQNSFEAAVVFMTSEDLRIEGTGRYTTQDVKVFADINLKDADGNALTLSDGDTIEVEAVRYTLERNYKGSRFMGLQKLNGKKVIE